jgi:hypothetical protein
MVGLRALSVRQVMHAERVDLVRHDEGGLAPLSDCAALGYRGLIVSRGAVPYGPGKTRRSVSSAGP